MTPLRDMDDRDLDRLLAGREIDDLEAGDLAGLVDDVRSTHLRPVAQETRARHLAAMTEAARLTPSTDPLPSVRARRSLRSLMPRNRFAATAAAVAATTMTVGLGGAGIAVAGADLPDAASAAFQKIGVSLPNQVTQEERAEQERENAVREFIAGTPTEERRGCAFGQQVAELARGEALPAEAKENCAKAEARRAEREAAKDAKGQGSVDAQEKRADAADERDSFGSQTSERAKGQRTATPEQRRQFGEDTANRARELGGAPERQARPAPSQQPPSGQDRRPESAGPPADVTPARPDSAGPPEGLGGARPGGAGR